MRIISIIVAVCISLTGIRRLAADEEAPLPHGEARFTAKAPVVDGEWKDGEWDEALPITFPAPVSAGNSRGEVRFLWTDAGMFVAFKTVDTTPVWGSFKQGEPLYLEDVFELFIDEVGDHRQFVEIQFDPAGQLYLRNNLLTAAPRITETGRLTQEFVERELWRYVIPPPEGMRVESRYDKVSGVWTLEMFLPAAFVSRRHGGKMEPCSWRINLVRHNWDKPVGSADRAQGEMLYWAPVKPGHPHLSPTLMGWLELKKP